MLPWAPVFVRQTRAEVIWEGHRWGLYIKASKLKHYLFPRKGSTQHIRRKATAPTSMHRLLLLVAALMLLGSTTATGTGVGGALGRVGLGGQMSILSDWRSMNLQHLAMCDLPHSMKQRYHSYVTPDADDEAVQPSVNPASFACVTPFTPEGADQANPKVQVQKDPEHGWCFGMHPDMTASDQQAMQDVLLEHKAQFAYSMNDLTGYTGQHPPFRINLTDDLPTISAQRRYSPAEVAIREEKRDELVRAAICVPAPVGCKWASCPTMPSKKNAEGLWTEKRFCCDYRCLNAKTVHDFYSLHLPEDLYYKVSDSVVFSKIDLKGAFHQLPIAVEDQPKTAWWDGNRLMMYTKLPYGTRCAPAHCQRVLDFEISLNGLNDCCVSFIDDLLIHSANMSDHLRDVARVLDMLKSCGLKAHPDKCTFCSDRIEYLGHLIGAGGLTPHEAKIATIRDLRTPTNVSELKSVLGFCNYYRVYLPSFSTLCAPLNELLKKGVPWEWTPARAQAYQALKDGLCQEGNGLRRFSTAADVVTTVYTDWSGVGVGAVLAQKGPDEVEHMVACISRSLNKHERNYSSYAGEMLGAVWAVKTFRQYLHGLHFKICTDHQPLTWLMRTPDLHGKHARWAMSLQEFDFEIIHRPGAKHQNADVLSRFPQPTTYDPTGACLDPELPAVWSPAAHLAAVAKPLGMERAVQQAVHESLSTAAPVSAFMDCYAPSASEVLQGNMGTLADAAIPEPDQNSEAAAVEQQELRQRAASWVNNADSALQHVHASVQQPLICATDGAVQQLCTAPVGGEVFKAAMGEGITLYEPFGGMCSALDSLLANGFTVARYLYSDTDPAAVAVARHRVACLHGQYPLSFPFSASADTFTALPADVRTVGAAELVSAGAFDGAQWMVVAGWCCQDLSRGGAGRGLKGSRSDTFYDVVRIVGALQQMQPHRPPGFVLENTYMQDHAKPNVRDDFDTICRVIGQPVVLDAARFGAYAHRARNYWSNMSDPRQVQLVCDGVQRAPGRFVDDVLDEGRCVAFVQKPRADPYYQCNVPGEPVCALPTLVAREASWSFRDDPVKGLGTGLIADMVTGALSEPTPAERERIMGFSGHCTAAPGVDEADRHAILGRAMDRYTTVALFSVYGALANCSRRLVLMSAKYQPPSYVPTPWQQMPAAPRPNPECVDGSVWGWGAKMMRRMGWEYGRSLGPQHSYSALQTPIMYTAQHGSQGLGYGRHVADGGGCHTCAVSSAAAEQLPAQSAPAQHLPAQSASAQPPPAQPAAAEQLLSFPVGPAPYELVVENAACDAGALQAEQIVIAATGADADVWADLPVIEFLTTNVMPLNYSVAERRRVRKRALVYSIRDGVLRRVMPNGTSRVVPPVSERFSLIKDTHERLGHFGMHRTEQQLQAGFWWARMRADVRQVVSNCAVCSQVNAVFGKQGKDLHPLSIEGLAYRWGVDLAGPFKRSKQGNVFAMICVEYFSKQIEVIALPDKTAECTAAAFLSAVICRYGAPAEVVTDGGAEWKGEFEKLLRESLIDHRVTSPNHPQADGLAERAVQTIKSSLTKLVADVEKVDIWDQQVQWITLGYRASKQRSTRLSPYAILFGTHPVLPPAIRPRFDDVLLDFADAEQAAGYLMERGELLNRHCVMAMGNLRIAQHRDTLQYQRIRSGSHCPALASFEPGDLVHVRRTNVINTLQSNARPGVYEVVEVRDSGVLIVRGCCGKTMSVHIQNCAPCHLANIDTTINPTLRLVGAEFLCEICETPDDDALMLVCDSCGLGFHTYCLGLEAVPVEPLWVCPVCTDAGITPLLLEAQRFAAQPPAGPEPDLFPNAKQQLADERAMALNGQWVCEPVGAGHQWGQLVYIPRTERGVFRRRPLFFRVPGGDQDRRVTTAAAEKLQQQGVVDALVRGVDLVGLSVGPFVTAASKQLQPGPYADVPESFDFQEVEGMQLAHRVLLEMDLSEAVATCMAARFNQLSLDTDVPPVVTELDARLLLGAVDMQSCTRILCPWYPNDVLQTALLNRYSHVLLLPVVNRMSNQYDPAFYKQFVSGGEVDWVFVIPPVGMEGIVLALAVKFARLGVAMLVDRGFLHAGQGGVHGAPAKQLLLRYKAADRLAEIHPPADGRVWIVVFSAVGHRTGMLSTIGSGREGWIVL